MPSFSLIAITGQPSYPLNSENASPPGTCRAYLSCAEMAAPLKTTSTPGKISSSQDGILVIFHSSCGSSSIMPQSRTACTNVRYGSLADVHLGRCDVRFAPTIRHRPKKSRASVLLASGEGASARNSLYFPADQGIQVAETRSLQPLSTAT